MCHFKFFTQIGKRMKKSRKKQKTDHILLWICAAVPLIFVLGYGIYRGICEYGYYRAHKSIQEIKLSFVPHWKLKRFETVLKMKFVSEMHNAGVIQKLPVTAENGKSFMIFRFEDDHIQLMSFPVRKYIGIGFLKAYYDITDKTAKEKILKLLDECQAVHSEISDTAK
jgi:hypothetical protein